MKKIENNDQHVDDFKNCHRCILLCLDFKKCIVCSNALGNPEMQLDSSEGKKKGDALQSLSAMGNLTV